MKTKSVQEKNKINKTRLIFRWHFIIQVFLYECIKNNSKSKQRLSSASRENTQNGCRNEIKTYTAQQNLFLTFFLFSFSFFLQREGAFTETLRKLYFRVVQMANALYRAFHEKEKLIYVVKQTKKHYAKNFQKYANTFLLLL